MLASQKNSETKVGLFQIATLILSVVVLGALAADTICDLPSEVRNLIQIVDTAAQPAKAVHTPQIANRPLRIRCDVQPESRAGVILAQDGRQHGYALHLEEGRPVFSVRIEGQVFSMQAAEAPAGRFSLDAVLRQDGAMSLAINGRPAATGKASGSIPAQPQDDLSIGVDARTPVGNGTSPNPLEGTVENVKVTTE